MSDWRMHAESCPLFAEYLLLAEEAGWEEVMQLNDLKIGTRDVLIVVDMQNDFVEVDHLNPHGGAFAVAEGSSVSPLIVQLMNHFTKCGGDVVLTRDYHPKKHCSFIPQKGPFPPHCVQGTQGSFFYEPIAKAISKLHNGDAHYKDEVRIAFKGFHEDIDSFGSFQYDEDSAEGRLAKTEEVEEKRLHGCSLCAWTGAVILESSNQEADPNAPPDVLSVLRRDPLGEFLTHRGTERVFVCGLAMDFCVLDTALNGTKKGFSHHMHLILDASRAAHLPSMGQFGTGFLSDPAAIKQKLKDHDVKVVPTAALLPGFTPSNPVCEKAALKHSFPKHLGPFALVKTKRLALWIDREKRTYKATAPFDEIRQLEANGLSPSGEIAAPAPITLKDDVKRSLGIPPEAKEFCWAYPVDAGRWSDQALAYFSISTPSCAFFAYGGYIYFDKRGRVVAMCAISLGKGLEFEEGQAWDSRFNVYLEKRWVRVTVPYILDKGARFFCWINGGEVLQPPCKDVLGGEPWQAPPNGCFVYLFSESSHLGDKRDVFFPVAAPSLSHKAFGRAGVSEEEAIIQLRQMMGGKTLDTVNISKVQQALEEWDANFDGSISEDEMAAALKVLNPKMSTETTKKLFAQADLNKDGRLDIQEFVSWLWPS
ncbi:unnamed protein product [Effrenium voratum]|nr:unnamed protein product [Effrenium voratum]